MAQFQGSCEWIRVLERGGPKLETDPFEPPPADRHALREMGIQAQVTVGFVGGYCPTNGLR